MKVCVFSYYDKKDIEKQIVSAGIKFDTKHPDFVVTYGGDGTILDAERVYPGVPKIPIRNSPICSRCRIYKVDELKGILEKVKKGDYTLREETKAEAEIRGKRIIGLNEVQIRNKYPNKSLRFSIGDEKKELIGDGVVVSTPYGSTAYYSAMGYKPFTSGIRLGLNNTMSRRESFEVKGKMMVMIKREKGLLLADNDKKMIELNPGDVVVIHASESVARFVNV